MSTSTFDEDFSKDFSHLGEEVYKLLGYVMKEPMFSENLLSLTLTVKSVLNLVKCAAMFLEDCSKPKLNGEPRTYFFIGRDSPPLHAEDLADPAARKPTLDEFGKELIIMKSSLRLSIGNDLIERRLPYTRKPIRSPTVSVYTTLSPQFSGDSRYEFRNQGREIGTGEANRTPWPWPYLNSIFVLTTPLVVDTLHRALDPEPEPTDSPGPGSLGDTRDGLLSDITTWLDNYSANAPNILWLYGAPGTGKTTISCSLIEELKRRQRCAGFFFFGEGKYTPSKLWRTLAYKIARFHPAIESEIYRAMENRTTDEDELDLDDVQITFSKLVCGPLKKTNMTPSSREPVLVIDALDQCSRADDDSWGPLLNTLSQWSSSLPSHCKLIITSRPQSDIAKAFGGGDIKHVELLTGDDTDSDTKGDVYAYLYHRFADMRRQDKSISEDWPDYDAISKLVDHTKGFFKWAAAAVDSIQTAGDKKKQLTAITEGGTTFKLDPFDKYLEGVLKTIFEENSFDSVEGKSSDASSAISPDTPESQPFNIFQETMGMNAFSKQPLTIADLGHFLQDRFTSTSKVSIEGVCYGLLPIISIEDEKKTIKIRHKAYKDYLTDPKRCPKKFFVDRNKVHKKMTISCLKIMQDPQGLKFNICGLESSYRMNSKVDDMDALIEKCIPSFLAYACQHWADHLRGIASTEKRDIEVIKLLRTFLDFRLLYWLEALSLRSESDLAFKSLSVAAQWLEV